MNITISINKEFGELTDRKIDRIASNFLNDVVNSQNIDSQIALFQFSNHALVLNKPNNEIAVSFGTLDDLKEAFDNFVKILELLDLDNVGRNRITIEDIQEKDFSVAKVSKRKINIDDESDGVGLRFLIDTFGDLPKEIKIEPRIDDFNKIYIYCTQVQNTISELTVEFIEKSVSYLLSKATEYTGVYLENGDIGGQ